MTILNLQLDSLNQRSDSKIVTASSLSLNLPQPPKRFFRHGWQSWTLTTWLDPSEPPHPIRSPKFRAKDEDPAYAFAKNHVSAWVGAVELGDDDITHEVMECSSFGTICADRPPPFPRRFWHGPNFYALPTIVKGVEILRRFPDPLRCDAFVASCSHYADKAR